MVGDEKKNTHHADFLPRHEHLYLHKKVLPHFWLHDGESQQFREGGAAHVLRTPLGLIPCEARPITARGHPRLSNGCGHECGHGCGHGCGTTLWQDRPLQASGQQSRSSVPIFQRKRRPPPHHSRVLCSLSLPRDLQLRAINRRRRAHDIFDQAQHPTAASFFNTY